MPLKACIKEFAKILGEKESFLDKNYPRIAESLLMHWGYKEIHQYINKLLVVDKDRNRQGLAVEGMKEIYLLQDLHNQLFPAHHIQSNEVNRNWMLDKKSSCSNY